MVDYVVSCVTGGSLELSCPKRMSPTSEIGNECYYAHGDFFNHVHYLGEIRVLMLHYVLHLTYHPI